MATITFQTDSTTLTLNGEVMRDLAEGDIISLTYPNAKTTRINASAGGVTVGERSDSGVADLVVRVQRMGAADIALQSFSNGGVVLINGSLKENFTKDGVDGVETYELQNGSITTRPVKTKNTTDGNALNEWTIQFRDAVRSL